MLEKGTVIAFTFYTFFYVCFFAGPVAQPGGAAGS